VGCSPAAFIIEGNFFTGVNGDGAVGQQFANQARKMLFQDELATRQKSVGMAGLGHT
jgi:hypothetical protein